MSALAILFGTASSCRQQNTPQEEGSRTAYAISFFKEVNTTIPRGENVIVSPYSAGVALSMLEAGAEGETKAEFDNALNGTYFKAENLGGDGGLTVNSANSIWISDNFSVRNRYVDVLEKDFDAFVGNYDFADPETVREINSWCSEKTNGKIEEIVDNLSPDMVMVLVNALYFNAPWEKSFNPELTHEDVFHAASGDMNVPMMYKKDIYDYAEYQGFQILGIPYAGGSYSMYIVLPPAGMNADSVLPYLGEDVYEAAMNMLAPKEVMLTMPKFRLTSSLVLNNALERMGILDAFGAAADFGGVSASGKLQLDVVKQKCYIDVSEKGTEAAAVTSSQIRMTSLVPVTVMNVDRPFFFFIADNENENILFAGKIVNLE